MQPTKKIKASEVAPGMLVDLEQESNNPLFEFEYAQVLEVERETANCIRIDFDGASIGFTPDYLLEVVVED